MMAVDVLHDGRGGVKPAGVVYGPRRLAEGGAADCLTLGDRPVTPAELRYITHHSIVSVVPALALYT
jgi:hypothetical protein